MAVVQHVFKRGSIYWWRRRLPDGYHSRALLLIEISLRTKSLQRAKLLAAEVTLASEHLIRDLRKKMIQPDDAKKILLKVARKHSAKLDSVAAAEIALGEDVEVARLQDIAAGWTNRLFAAQGDAATIGDSELREMRAAGLDDLAIDSVRDLLDFYRLHGIYPPPHQRIQDLLEEFGIPDTRTNFQQAQQLYLRGLSTALLDTQRRWIGIRPDDNALLQAALIADASLPPSFAEPRLAVTRAENAEPMVLQPLDSDDDIDEDEDDLEEDSKGLVEIIDQAAVQNVKAGDWTEKTAKQHISLARLFVRFVGHDNPTKMRQRHISDFKTMLSGLPKNYGKSPQDHIIPLTEILERAATLPPEKTGLSPSTMNRHMTQMGNIADICKHAGFPFGDFEGVSGLRSKKKGSGRGERPRFNTDELRLLFNLPIWNGCSGEDERLLPGTALYHDAAYWVPMLALYHGARREEYCGLFLSEVEIDADIPCLCIEPNTVRNLKTVDSKRRVPIHPELLRLGFSEYVAALRKLGHELLFPELKAAASSTPMGDVFDDTWQAMRTAALPKAKEEGKVLHSLRHWCNNEMKQAGVHAEIRKDILGHTNDDVNEGRYSDAARLRVMGEALAHLPQPTAHLSKFPIHLIERVLRRLSPPTKVRKAAR